MASSPSFLVIQKKINDNYGNVLRRANEKTSFPKLPTGIFNIDFGFKGGLPANMPVLLAGHKSCYKTYLALKIIASYQARCSFCFELQGSCVCGGQFAITGRDEERIIKSPLMVVFVDAEHALDVKHAAKLGVDVDSLELFDPPFGESACEYVEAFAKIPEVGMIIIDSLASIVPEAELEKGYFDKIAQGLRSRLLARMYRALVSHLSKPGFPPRIAIGVNHLLPNRDGFGDIMPGGETQQYHSAIVLKTWLVRKQYLTLTKKGEEKLEKEEGKVQPPSEEDSNFRKQPVGFLIEHSKVSPDLVKGEFEVCLGDGDDLNFGDTDDFSVVYWRANKLGLTGGAKRGDLRKLWLEDRIAYERVKKQIIKSVCQ